ncbi:MAG TPA: TlyA family RNA methyltransferase [Ilumatobacteraceae bacterium]|jgi:23S rRNA (cytidine1920-2'-O)/16S rRNA (cytidine1409-2'-O)-methyltransferase
MPRRQRLDAELVRRRLASSRAEASRSIDAGLVLVNGSVADKAARLVDPGDAVVLQGPPSRYVSRGGDKLDAALDGFGIDVRGLRVLDAGASTGGFTDCLLQRGAREVVAVDVGHGQLHPKIRGDRRVAVHERFHVRDLSPGAIGGAVDLVVADLSFISIVRALPWLLSAGKPGAELVLLVKPQFEAGRAEVDRGSGVIRDATIHARVRAEVTSALEEQGCAVLGWIDSPITGAQGNREFLVHARAGRAGSAS